MLFLDVDQAVIIGSNIVHAIEHMIMLANMALNQHLVNTDSSCFIAVLEPRYDRNTLSVDRLSAPSGC